MATLLFTEQENGNLKLVAEVEGIDNAALAVDALLDEQPRLKADEFIAVIGSIEDGIITRVIIDDPEPVNPRRSIRVVSNGAVEVEEEEKPKRRAPARKPAQRKAAPARKKPGPKPKAKPGPKPKAKAAPKKAAAKKGGSPFKRNPASDE